MRLNTANDKFMITIILPIYRKGSESGTKRIIKEKRIAKQIFEKGPARATMSSPVLRFLKLYGLIMTGFAQPKPTPAKEVMRGMINEPKSSRCLNGFSVSLPCILAVGSPSKRAEYP